MEVNELGETPIGINENVLAINRHVALLVGQPSNFDVSQGRRELGWRVFNPKFGWTDDRPNLPTQIREYAESGQDKTDPPQTARSEHWLRVDVPFDEARPLVEERLHDPAFTIVLREDVIRR
jgi:hypothetical protein